jgi:hypothetical protein
MNRIGQPGNFATYAELSSGSVLIRDCPSLAIHRADGSDPVKQPGCEANHRSPKHRNRANSYAASIKSADSIHTGAALLATVMAGSFAPACRSL